MDITEFIGFLVMLAVILYSASQGVPPQEELEEKLDKKREEAEQELERILGSEPLPPPAPSKPSFPVKKQKRSSVLSPLQHRTLQSPLQTRQLKTKLSQELEERSPENFLQALMHRRQGNQGLPSRIEKRMARLSRLQDLLIYQEIMGRPKGLRDE